MAWCDLWYMIYGRFCKRFGIKKLCQLAYKVEVSLLPEETTAIGPG